MLRLVCPICSSTCTIVDESSKTIACPYCGKRFDVDTAAQSGTEEEQLVGNVDDSTTQGWMGQPAAEVNQPDLYQRIGKYELDRELGRGGFGIVYLARDNQLLRNVALKIANPRRGKSTEISNEARIAAQLRHPGIATVLDLGIADDGRWYIVTDFVPGKSLYDLIRIGRIPLAQSVSLMAKVARAIHYAHKNGIVHRDLKPSNILLDEMGEPKIVDFGLAVHEDFQHQLQGEIAGTPAYMAPEQVEGKTHLIDGRTDEWSFGCILYELLTFRKAFARTGKALFEEISVRAPKPPRQINDAIPRELEKICLTCLEKEIRDRFPSMLDIAEQLEMWVEQNQNGTDPVGATSDRSPSEHPNPPSTVPNSYTASTREGPEKSSAVSVNASAVSAPLPIRRRTNIGRWGVIAVSALAVLIVGASVIALRPRTFRYDDPIESQSGPGTWQILPLEGVQPRALGFTISVHRGNWNFDPRSRVLSMDSKEVGVIGLGKTMLQYYELQAELSRTQWQSRGSAGVFFGCRRTRLPNGEDAWVMQSIGISIKSDGRTFLTRDISEMWLSSAGSPLGNGRELAWAQIEPIKNDPVTIHISLFDGQLTSVRLNGQEYRELLTVNADGKKYLIDGAGEFGVSNIGGATRFSNFRFINPRRSQQ